MKKIAVTGATGMLAATLLQLCIEKNIEVLAICRPHSKKRNNIPASDLVQVLECDIADLSAIDMAEKDYDTFFHFGWDGTFGNSRNDTYLQNANIRFTLDAVHLAHDLGCKTFVGAGSQAECGRVTEKISGATFCDPETGYGIGKYTACKLSRLYCNALGMRHNWGRILSTYGPMDNDYTMIMSNIKKMLDGEIAAFTKGEQQWDYLFSEDAANAFYCIGANGMDGKIYPVGSGKTRLLADYIKTMRDAIDPELPVAFGKIPYMPKQVMYLCADLEEFTNDTGYQPRVDFETGIRKTIEWCKKEWK